MLHLIPRRLHRAAYRAAHFLRAWWWRLSKPVVEGACVIARNDAGCVLLVRLSYGSGRWQFPGGGMAAGEDPLLAGLREFAEETGLDLHAPRLLGQQVEQLHGATNIVHVIAGQSAGIALPNGREIVAAQWFARDALPPDRSASVDARLALLD